MAMAPGWYQDPFSSSGYVRWWDGQRWGASTTLPEGMAPAGPGIPVPLPPPGAAAAGAPVQPQVPVPPSSPSAPSSWQQAPPPQWGAPQAPAPGAYGAPQATSGWSAGAPYELATWGTRAAARVIDVIITTVISMPFVMWVLWPSITAAMDAVSAGGSMDAAMQDYVAQLSDVGTSTQIAIITAIITFFYEVPQNVLFGRTIGKRVLGLKVRQRDDDRNLGWGAAIMRWGVFTVGQSILSFFWTIPDYLWPFWDRPWRQTLHDKAARSTVVPSRGPSRR
jgi:uncharacterized RDD family membrane protein YckC